MRGVIVGSAGRGRGLDDPDFEPIWKAADDAGLFVFIHPHYGVGHGLFPDTGHAMMLALGFTFETSIAVALLILRGVLERHPGLKLLIAHAGGTLPYLAGRLDSCVKNDISKDFGLPRPPSHYLRQCWYDSIAYHGPALAALTAFAIPPRSCSAPTIPSSPARDRRHLGQDDLARAGGEPAGAVVTRCGTAKAIAYANGLAAFAISLP